MFFKLQKMLKRTYFKVTTGGFVQGVPILIGYLENHTTPQALNHQNNLKNQNA